MKSSNKSLAAQTAERDSIIVCRTSQGYEVRATPLRITRDVVAFEVYNPYSILQLSEVLKEFRIIVNEQLIYSGRAIVSNLVNTGSMLVCEATLDEAWLDVDLFALVTQPNKLRGDFTAFLKEWEKIHAILPQYKIVLADMQNYFMDLRRWLEQVELGIRSSLSGNRQDFEREVTNELAPIILPSLNSLFARFEEAADAVDEELRPFHRTYTKRQLHPHLLCSPFAHRTYHKPLGYAGDYEMVNMIIGDPLKGSSLFAKTINLWFLSQAPAEAHRNRIKYLTKLLAEETSRVANKRQRARIFNLGCGPAGEIQNFLSQNEICDWSNVTLLDFNDETLQHARTTLEDLLTRFHRSARIEMIKKSVHQVLKDATRLGDHTEQYDLIYCAGLFDYLSDRICKRLMNIFYDMLAPGGLLVATNVNTSNPSRQTMEQVLEWHLIYRSREQLMVLAPDLAPDGSYRIKADPTGCNVLIEVRRNPLE
jgi:extracellular factor (EF) 3-hydroxypalmitic acid methyl ester biosynthesis protein